MTELQLNMLIKIAMSQFENIDEYQANTIVLVHRPILNELRWKWAMGCILNNKISF